MARALLAEGAKADAQSAAGFTPLYMAAQENHAGCVKMLLAAGASQTLATEVRVYPLNSDANFARHIMLSLLEFLRIT